MNLKNKNWVVYPSAALLTLLFYKQGIGLNLVLFEIVLLVFLAITKQLNSKNKTVLIASIAFICSGIFTITSYSTYTYIIHFLTALVFVGALNFPKVRSISSAFAIAVTAIVMAQITFATKTSTTTTNKKSIGKTIWSFRVFLIPIIIVFIFLLIYSGANSAFGDIVDTINNSIAKFRDVVFEKINISIVFTYLFCLFLSIILLVRYRNKTVEEYDQYAPETLKRNRVKSDLHYSNLGLKNEYKAGVFLFISLNVLLLIVNFLDIKNVWFGFEWDGDTLKEFVHEGTYLLLLSIIISIGLVLYYFRRNLNFYPNNQLLKIVSYVWIFQNAVLVISVAIRNFKYIEYYALAYKRIGVVLFLLATFYGLFTVYKKVKDRKSAFYLFKNNSLCIFIILVLSSAVPWDNVIAKYNFANSHNSYVHLSYLASFSYKSLPYLDQPFNKIVAIKENQHPNFDEHSDMSVNEYDRRIQLKKASFKKKWERKTWLAWNFAEARAYQKLFLKTD